MWFYNEHSASNSSRLYTTKLFHFNLNGYIFSLIHYDMTGYKIQGDDSIHLNEMSNKNSSQLIHCLLNEAEDLELTDIDRESVMELVKIPKTLFKLKLTNIRMNGDDYPAEGVKLRYLKEFIYRDDNTSERLKLIPFGKELFPYTRDGELYAFLNLDIMTWEPRRNNNKKRITNHEPFLY